MPDQRSVTDQMRTLVTFATLAGLYDAADWVLDNFFDRRSDLVPPGTPRSVDSAADTAADT
jgi:hypothetical protein